MFTKAIANIFQALNAIVNRPGSYSLNDRENNPGSEFRAAREAAISVGANIVLGDRRIQCTLRRAWKAMTVREKLFFGSAALRVLFVRNAFSLQNTDSRLLEIIRSGYGSAKVVEEYIEILEKSFPSLWHTLVVERDKYLAWSMKRSKAVNAAKLVVGVIGLGHVQGILKQMDDDDMCSRLGGNPWLQFSSLTS